MLKDGPVRALGAMSGTSMDGIDAAMLVTDGVQIVEFGETGYRPFSDAERAQISAALGTWNAPDVEELVTSAHAKVLAGFEGADLVGFHGQTLAHDPGGRGTYQAGKGAVLARRLGVPVVWDFRSADVELGGQGAPLAPFFHWACARWIGATDPVAFLNLGGVGNITWVDPTAEDPASDGALLAFDTGPANAPMNDVMMARLGEPYDDAGALGASGAVAAEVVEDVLAHPYFQAPPPKSLDRNSFENLTGRVAALGDADALATLAAVAATAVAQAIDHLPQMPQRLLVTGGGRHNSLVMQMIAAGTGIKTVPVEDVGLDGDMLEAQAFAYLAVRVARGLPTSAPGTTGVPAAVGGGTISRP